MERIQLNLRIDKELEQAIDGRRIELQKKLGYIPTRSDIARLALDEYLGRSAKAQRARRQRGTVRATVVQRGSLENGLLRQRSLAVPHSKKGH